MPNPRRYTVALLLICAGLLSACSTMGAGGAEVADDEHDPFEGLNRAIFRINESFDVSILKPVARGYDAAVPDVLKLSIANFLSNLLQPTVAINDLLQGKFRQSGQDTARFIINTTIGFGGLFDVARDFDLPANEEDFGQTLATWGVADGPYLVFPILGPRNLRDGVGWIVDQFAYPLNYRDERAVVWGGRSLDIVDTRARFLPADKVLEQAAGDDKYLFVREAYRQRRRNLIYDGNPPKEDFFLDDPAPSVPGQPKQ